MRPAATETPPVNIYESNGQLTLAIPMPGAHDDTVEVVLEGRRLRAQAEARYAQEQQRYLRHEWSVGRFQCDIELPRPVQAAGAKAMLTHGVLTISLPIVVEGDKDRKGEGGRVRIPVGEPTAHQAQLH